MNRQSVIVLAGVVIAVLAGLFILVQLKRAELAQKVAEDQIEETTQPFTISRVDAKHYYNEADGVHTVAGEILLPTPCHLLDTNVVILGEAPGRAMITFDVINNSEGDAACAEVMTPQRFKVGFEAPKDIPIDASFNDQPVELNLVPAAEGESPADFELFIKG